MCKDMNEKEVTKARTSETTSPRRLIGLAALNKLDEKAKGVSEIRQAFEEVRQQHEQCGKELATTEGLIEQMEDQIMDEAMAIAAFQSEDQDEDDRGTEHDQDEDDECGCGCGDRSEGEDDMGAASYDDEQRSSVHHARNVDPTPIDPPARKRPGLAPLVFGALGVACAVASLVARSLADEREE
jgi:hypothetical protein